MMEASQIHLIIELNVINVERVDYKSNTADVNFCLELTVSVLWNLTVYFVKSIHY
jgi:hypothetical protein